MSPSETPEWLIPLNEDEIQARRETDAAKDVTEGLTSRDMVRILRIPAPTFQQWCNRGLISTLMVKHKGRTYRRYTVNDLWRAAAMGAFCREGFEPAVAKRLAEMAEKAKNSAWEQIPVLQGEPLNCFAAISLSVDNWVLTDGSAGVDQIVAKLGSDTFIMVNLDAVRAETNRVTAEAFAAIRTKRPEAEPE